MLSRASGYWKITYTAFKRKPVEYLIETREDHCRRILSAINLEHKKQESTKVLQSDSNPQWSTFDINFADELENLLNLSDFA